MTVTTVFASTADGWITSAGASFTIARAGTGSFVVQTASTALNVAGSFDNFGSIEAYESFYSFDTSPVPDTDAVSAAALSIWGFSGSSTIAASGANLEVSISNWGASLTSADWVPGASISGLTLVATFTGSGWSDSAYNNFTENGTNFQTAIDKLATTFIMVSTDRLRTNTGPGAAGQETAVGTSANNTGTTRDPKLVITSAPAPTASNKDTATRFALRVQNFKDAATRFKLSALNYKDTATRFKLSALNYKNTLTRFSLRIQSYKDAATRFSIGTAATSFKNAAIRFALRVRNYKDTSIRFALSINSYKDAATRLVLRAQGYKDSALRFSLSRQSFRDLSTRFALRIQNYRDTASRFSLRVQNYRDTALRFSMRIASTRDVSLRFRIQVGAIPTATHRHGWWWWRGDGTNYS